MKMRHMPQLAAAALATSIAAGPAHAEVSTTFAEPGSYTAVAPLSRNSLYDMLRIRNGHAEALVAEIERSIIPNEQGMLGTSEWMRYATNQLRSYTPADAEKIATTAWGRNMFAYGTTHEILRKTLQPCSHQEKTTPEENALRMRYRVAAETNALAQSILFMSDSTAHTWEGTPRDMQELAGKLFAIANQRLEKLTEEAVRARRYADEQAKTKNAPTKYDRALGESCHVS